MSLSREDGSTLIELLVGASLALVILTAALTTLMDAFSVNGQVADRIDSLQRARVAMDTMTRELRSSVCPDPLTSSLVSGTDNSATFFVDLSDGSKPPAKHTLTFNPVARTITESRYDGTGFAPATTWPATPTATRVLIGNLVATGTDPVFRFTAFDTATPPRPTVVLATPLTTATVGQVSRITIAFTARPTGRSTTSAQSTPLLDEVDLRSADPNQPRPTPQCV